MHRKFLMFLNGEAGVGKDTFVTFFSGYAKKTYGIETLNRHRSDPAKAALSTLGWNGEKTKEVRELLADLVTFGESTGITRSYLDSTLYTPQDDPTVVFFHVRDPKTISKLQMDYFSNKRALCEPRSLLIRRDVQPAETDRWGVLEGSYDWVIVLNNLEDSRKKAHMLADTIAETMYWERKKV